MKKKLLTPGPVPISHHLLQELTKPIIHHRTREFSQLFKEILSQLQFCFQTKNPVLVLTATGTGAMQAALTNALSPGDKALFLVNGAFGKRWAEMAKIFGIEAICYEINWGETFEPNKVEDKLKEHKNIKAVFGQACETSTGVMNPVKEISKKVKAHSKDILFVIDGITAVGVSSINMDEDEIDILVAGSQKAFANPTGLSFIGLSPKAQAAVEVSRTPKYYFDLRRELKANKNFQTAFSSPVSLLFLLKKSLDELSGEKLKQQVETCKGRQTAIIGALKEFGLSLFSQSTSPSLSVFRVPSGVDGTKLKNRLEDQHGIVIAGGQGQLKGKIIRVGHMGHIPKEDYVAFIEALFEELRQMGYELKEKALQKALTHLEKL